MKLFSLSAFLFSYAAVCADQHAPLYDIKSNSSTWPQPQQGLYMGDIRAVLNVTGASSSIITAQIFWRRRDDNPAVKSVIVIHSITGETVPLTASPSINSGCGGETHPHLTHGVT